MTEIYDFPCDSVNLLYDEFLNTEELGLNDISVFPNPFDESITVSFKDANTNKEITLQDIQGKLIQTHSTRDKKYTLNTFSLSSGFYLLTCVVDGQKTTFKLIRK